MRPVMLITGGSRGIGRATALRAARAGWSIAIGYRSAEAEARAVLDECRDLGAAAVAGRVDVANEAEVTALFHEAEAALGRLDAVVVNAGIVGPALPLAEMDGDRLRRMVDVNLMGALYTAREAARRLPRAAELPAGAIVLVSSGAARNGSPGVYVDYAATKGALDTLTVGFARELAGQNVRVNGVRPGLIDTGIHASGGLPDRAAKAGETTPLGRAGRPEEVAEAILWLCSEAASFTTGAILDVTGGR